MLNIPMLYAVRDAIKPVLRVGFHPSETSRMELLAERFGVELAVVESNSMLGVEYDEPVFNAYFSKSRRFIDKTIAIEKGNWTKEMILKIAKLYGYPECCVDFYIRNIYGTEPRPDLIAKILENTSGKPSFLLNNIYRTETKGFLTKVPDTFVQTYSFISHIPCSFSCKDSLKIARKTYDSFKENEPRYAFRTKETLLKPILVFNDSEWVSFDGEITGNAIFYDGIMDNITLLPESQMVSFKQGDSVRVSRKRIDIMSGNNIIKSIRKRKPNEGVILDFSSESDSI